MTADTLASLLLARAGDDRPGLVFEERVWSWREHVAACRAAGARLSGHGAGTHVGVLGENVPGMVVLIGGAALAGHVVVALNPTRSAAELARDARATDVTLLLADDPYRDVAQRLSRELGVPELPLTLLTDPEPDAQGSGTTAPDAGPSEGAVPDAEAAGRLSEAPEAGLW